MQAGTEWALPAPYSTTATGRWCEGSHKTIRRRKNTTITEAVETARGSQVWSWSLKIYPDCTLGYKAIISEADRPELEHSKNIWEKKKREKYKRRVAGGHKTREQEPVSITKADIQQQVSGTKSRTAPGPDVSPVCSLKKLTALLDHLTGQTGGWLWRIYTRVHMCCSKNTKTDGIRNRKRNYHGWLSPWTTLALLLTCITDPVHHWFLVDTDHCILGTLQSCSSEILCPTLHFLQFSHGLLRPAY